MAETLTLNVQIVGNKLNYSEIESILDSVKIPDVDLSIIRLYSLDMPFDEQSRKWMTTTTDIVFIFLSENEWADRHGQTANLAIDLSIPVIPIFIGKDTSKAIELPQLFHKEIIVLHGSNPDSMQRLNNRIKELIDEGILNKKQMRPDVVNAPSPHVDIIAENILVDEPYEADDMGQPDSISNADLEDDSGDYFDEIIRNLIGPDDDKRAEQFDVAMRLSDDDRLALAARLRFEINGKYGPGGENDNFDTSNLYPQKIVSVRSWMFSLLIRIDPSGAKSQGLTLKHINESVEPDQGVRFWILAGLIWNRSSLLDAAAEICLGDSQADVRTLARAVQEIRIGDLVSFLKGQLSSQETVWAALRTLRVITLPVLTSELCNLLMKSKFGSNTAYDTLYILGNSDMARGAAEELQVFPDGVEATIRHIIATSRRSEDHAMRTFVALLAELETSEVDRVLKSEVAKPKTGKAAQRVRMFLEKHRASPSFSAVEETSASAEFTLLRDNEVSSAIVNSDINDIENDLLDIRKDVQTLTAVMLAKDVKPPLAIGLFGDWGTGKSFFMESMEAAAKKLAENSTAPESKFNSNIVQIWFNAWHYIDTNLWASLVSKIFTDLQAYVAPVLPDAEKIKKLESNLKDAQKEIEEIETEKNTTQEQLNIRQAELEELKKKREMRKIGFSDMSVSDLTEIFVKEPGLKEQMNESLQEIGMSLAMQNAEELSQVVAEAHSLSGRTVSIFLALSRASSPYFLIGGMLAILFLVPAAAYFLIKFLSMDSLIVTASSLVAQITGIIVLITAFLKPAVKMAAAGLAKVEQAKHAIDEKIAEKRRQPTAKENQLQAEIDELKRKEEEASARVSTAAKQADNLRRQILDLEENRSLINFLTERNRSEDYRKHLGIISTIRQDFKALEDRMKHAGANPTPGLKHADRIILYIDDLDRCPADKVMEVLQAVHLLLAYKLFVVVVGVDPHWLLHSLEETYSAFKNNKSGGGTSGSWQTTPQNYLEKIFQIPFNLKPMTSAGYGDLIKGLFSSSKLESKKNILPPREIIPEIDTYDDGSKDEVERGRIDDLDPLNVKERDLEHALTGKIVDRQLHEEPKVTVGPVINDEKTFIVRDEALVFQTWEVQFAQDLFGLSSTPRSAKRFTNIYRILKAQVRSGDFSAFEGTEKEPGTFQLPMLLLAMLLYSPEECVKLFPLLMKHAANKDKKDEIIQSLKKEGEFPQLSAKALLFLERDRFPYEPDLMLEWIRRVSRFSFDVGREVH